MKTIAFIWVLNFQKTGLIEQENKSKNGRKKSVKNLNQIKIIDE